MKKATLLGVVVAVAALTLLAVALLRVGPSSVLLQDATAHPQEDGSVAITISMSAPETPVRLLNISSEEAGTSGFTTEKVLTLPGGSSPSLALDGVHGVLDEVSGALSEGRLIPIKLTFSDGEARTKARVVEANSNPHAGHTMTIDAPEMELHLDVSAVGDGWSLRVNAPGLQFSRDAADGPHVQNQGHGHLYLDNLKLQRLYEPGARIGPLPTGTYDVVVTLNSNDHRAYAVDGKPLIATAEIVAR